MIVRLKGVKKVRSKGKDYFYHRRTMTRLPGVPGSAEFVAKLSELTRRVNGSLVLEGLGALVAAYRSSPEFGRLAPATRYKYQGIFDELKPLDDAPLIAITTEFLYGWRDKKAEEKSRSFANFGIIVFRLLFAWGKRRGKCKANPALDIELIRKPRNAPVKNRPWRPEEVARVLEAAPPWMRVPIAIAAYTGLRESDVVRVTWQCYDGQAFETRMKKTGLPVWIPAHYRLRSLLDAAPRVHDQIVVGARGAPISQSGLSTEFWRLLVRLRDAGRIGAGLSFHGLRHTLGTALAEAGCDAQTIAAVLGQATTKMAEHYSRTADRRGLAGAAMEKLEKKDAGRGAEKTPAG